MKEETKERLLARTLGEYAERVVPGDLDGWPAIQNRLPTSGRAEVEQVDLSNRPSTAALLQADAVLESTGPKPAAAGDRARAEARRRPSLSLAATMVVVLGLAAAGATFLAQKVPTGQGANSFVPPGKVRHVVMSVTWSDTSIGPRTDEIWYGNGQNHLLMYIIRGGLEHGDAAFVDEDAIYEYQPGVAGGAGGTGGEVDRYPYTPRYLAFYGPIPQFRGLLQAPDIHVVGNETLHGRPVVEVENAEIQIESQTPVPFSFQGGRTLPTAEPPSDSKRSVLEDVHRWIDTDTNQVLKAVVEWTDLAGPRSGDRQSQTIEVTVDELRDADEFPLGEFKFTMPEGARLVDKNYPPGATPVPTETVGR